MRIIVAVDLNDGAEALVDDAVRWAGRMAAKVDVVYVDEHSFDVFLMQDMAVRTALTHEWEKLRSVQEGRLAALLERIPEGMRGEAVFRSGRAADEIAAAAEGRDAVFVGTHGRRGLAHTLLGSVAERVVRLAPVPVLVLKSVAR
jgi:nucleotide-binding universal stress UspA family protein